MRRSFAVLALASAVAALPIEASARPPSAKTIETGRRLGLGLSLGDALGPSIKWFMHPKHALQGHLAYGLLHHGDGILTVDYLFHTRSIGDSPITEARFYIGLGIGLGFWAKPGPANLQAHSLDDRNRGGAAMMLRAPVGGLTFHWLTVPLDTALEVSWSPYVVLPDLRHGDGSIKVRYYF